METYLRRLPGITWKVPSLEMADVESGKRKHSEKTLRIKYEALCELEKGIKNYKVAEKYGVRKTTLSTWKKSKDNIFNAFKKSGIKRQRVKDEVYDTVNKALSKWILLMRAENILVSGPMLRTKGLEYAKQLGYKGFQVSEGWLSKWKERYGIIFKAVSGEVNSVSSEVTAPWKETVLPTLLSRYELKDIYNADEFGLFYQCLSNRPLHLKGERCAGGKYGKMRLTGTSAGNAVGEMLPLFVIGKSVNPRCLWE